MSLNPLQELQLADYGQRLTKLLRNPLLGSGGGDSGKQIFDRVHISSQMASHQNSDIVVGNKLNGLVLDTQHPVFIAKPVERFLSTAVYHGDSDIIEGTMLSGNYIRRQRAVVGEEYREAMNGLLGSLDQGLHR